MHSQKQALSLVSVLKAQYETMLVRFGVEKTLGAVTIAARDMPMAAFVSKIWDGKGYLPTEHTYCLLNELEKTCLNSGISFEPFFLESLIEDHYGTFLNPREAFAFTNQILYKVFRVNLLQFLFEHLEEINSHFNPGTHHVPIKFSKNKEICSMWTFFDINIDVCLNGNVIGIMLSSMPHWFGYRMKTGYTIHSEKRSIAEQLKFVESCGFLSTENNIPITTMDFGSYCELKNIPFPEKVLKKRNPIIEIPEIDVVDKHTNRVLLRKGTAYNAPGILSEITYPCKPTNREFNLKKVEQGIYHENSEYYLKARILHEKLLSTIDRKVTIDFDVERGVLFYNGDPVTKGKPGHMLALMVEAWCAKRKTEFKNSDFLSIKVIKGNKFDKSFNITVQRMQKIIRNKMPLFTVERITGTGVIRFDCSAEVIFREVNR